MDSNSRNGNLTLLIVGVKGVFEKAGHGDCNHGDWHVWSDRQTDGQLNESTPKTGFLRGSLLHITTPETNSELMKKVFYRQPKMLTQNLLPDWIFFQIALKATWTFGDLAASDLKAALGTVPRLF